MPTNPDTLLAACITEVDRLLKMCDAAEPTPYKTACNMAAIWPRPSQMVVARFDCMGQHKVIIAEGTNSQHAKLIAAAVNLMRPALEDYKARLNNIEQSFHASSEPIWAAAILEPSVQSIARVLAANSPEIAAMVEVKP